jgi:hypothetical protein
MKTYDTLPNALADLKIRGYEADFTTTSDCLYCSDVDIRLNPAEFTIEEVYHFKVENNPDEGTVVYVITSHTGVKGVLVDGYGVNARHEDFQVAHHFHTHHTVFEG